MIAAFFIVASLQASALADQPVYAFDSEQPANVLADCAVASLRGQRLGANIFTLRPELSRVFDGFLILVGPTLRITVEPNEEGSKLRLYSLNFVRQLSEKLDQCRDDGGLSPSAS